MRKQKKSQITMIMIIGLALFIIVSLVLYLSKSSLKKQSQQGIKKTQETAIEAQPVQEFVAKCLDKLSKDAVVLLGRQGGYIYKSQGGTLVDYSDADEGLFFVKYQKDGNDFKAAYNILPPRFIPGPPAYPWETFPCETKACDKKPVFEWYFGINNIPPLIPSQGTNSIQSQIETFIDGNMQKCADFSFFENRGLEIEMSTAKTSVIIGTNDVSISSKIPIKITNRATGEAEEISDFSASLNLRIKELYYFARDIAANDVKNIRFNISDLKNEKNSFRILLPKDALSKDDLITITDDKSLVYGSPYQYTFSRRNRNPALYYIKNDVLEFPKNYEIKLSDLLGATELKAEDPDEDDLEFSVAPALPNNNPLLLPQQTFKIEVSDGILSDYQIITVNRIES